MMFCSTRELSEDGGLLGQVGDAQSRPLVHGQGGNLHAIEENPARELGVIKPTIMIETVVLPAPLGAEEAGDLARVPS